MSTQSDSYLWVNTNLYTLVDNRVGIMKFAICLICMLGLLNWYVAQI